MEEKVELKVVQQMKAFPRFNRRPFYSYVQDSISSPCEQLNERSREERWKRSEASCLKPLAIVTAQLPKFFVHLSAKL